LYLQSSQLHSQQYFGLTTTVISEQHSNIIPEFWRHRISEGSGLCVLITRLVVREDLLAFDIILGWCACIWLYLGWFTCIWHYPWMVYLHLTLTSDGLLAFDITFGWFTCVWFYPWMICLRLTLSLDDLLAFDIILGWFACICPYPWMIYLHLILPLDGLLAFDINLLNTELNPICHLLASLGSHPILDVSRIRVNLGRFTCIWHYLWMVYLRLTLLLNDLLAFDFIPGWFTCIWHYR
jgi:hypothetical protein